MVRRQKFNANKDGPDGVSTADQCLTWRARSLARPKLPCDAACMPQHRKARLRAGGGIGIALRDGSIAANVRSIRPILMARSSILFPVNASFNAIRCDLPQSPSRRGLLELLFKEPESHARTKPIHRLDHLAHIPFVFLFICRRELLKISVLRVDQLHRAFKDYRFRGVVGADHASR